MKIAPLTLGTVQLGIPYGIANAGGKPEKAVSDAILAEALRHGITTWDTSRHYGNSEAVIGRFLHEDREIPQNLLLVSKFQWSAAALTDVQRARQEAKAHVQQSLDALGIQMLPLLLYHKGPDQPMEPLMRMLPAVMKELQEIGWIGKGGISVYYPEEVLAIRDDYLQAVQVPVSVFDQRIVHNGGLAQLRAQGKFVFARSVFLQGLFFLDEPQIPLHLQEAIPWLRQLRELVRQSELDTAPFAFSYVRDLPGITSVVFGAENPDQVRQNAALLQVPALSAKIRTAVTEAFRELPRKVITPGLW